MLRHLAEPLDSGLFQRDIGVETLGNGVGDHRLPLLFQQFDQPLLLGNQPINPGGFIIEKS
ncbi:hypothetical protein D3C87_1727170 [compost metagenome]